MLQREHQVEFEESFEAYVGVAPVPERMLDPENDLDTERAGAFLESWGQLIGDLAIRDCYLRHCADRTSLDSFGEAAWTWFNEGRATCDDPLASEDELIANFQRGLETPP